MTLRNTVAPRDRGSRGQALVEFAIVFPVAIVIILAVFDVGRMILIYNGLSNAAREGARLAIVNQDKALIVQRVEDMTFASELSNAGTPDDLVSFRKDGPSATDPLANPVCAPVTTGCVAVVTARADWTAITPLIGSLLGPINLSSRSELPVEFVCPNANIPAYGSSASCPRQP
jgi:Flp pilus assembly protein TadG